MDKLDQIKNKRDQKCIETGRVKDLKDHRINKLEKHMKKWTSHKKSLIKIRSKWEQTRTNYFK